MKKRPEALETASAADANATPDKVVRQFLDAARSGDQKKLSNLMTKKAREETAKHNINFELDSYQHATFAVGDFEYLTPEHTTAHVSCKWTDHDGDADFSHDVIWVMRKEQPGWRVVGMITRPFPDAEPVAFNYENIPELLATKASIEQETKRRAQMPSTKSIEPSARRAGSKRRRNDSDAHPDPRAGDRLASGAETIDGGFPEVEFCKKRKNGSDRAAKYRQL